jgi:hypothetical protein
MLNYHYVEVEREGEEDICISVGEEEIRNIVITLKKQEELNTPWTFEEVQDEWESQTGVDGCQDGKADSHYEPYKFEKLQVNIIYRGEDDKRDRRLSHGVNTFVKDYLDNDKKIKKSILHTLEEIFIEKGLDIPTFITEGLEEEEYEYEYEEEVKEEVKEEGKELKNQFKVNTPPSPLMSPLMSPVSPLSLLENKQFKVNKPTHYITSSSSIPSSPISSSSTSSTSSDSDYKPGK